MTHLKRTYPTRAEWRAERRKLRAKAAARGAFAFMSATVATMMCATSSLAAPERSDAPTAEQVETLKRVNTAFGSAYDRGDRYVSGEKSSVELCNFADKALAEGWSYVYGAKGQVMNPSLISSIIGSNLDSERSPYNRTGYIASTMQQSGNRATDCSGLIMTFMWWAGDESNPVHGLCPEIGGYNANAMLAAASERGAIDTMPEIPGLLVHRNGHVGIYIGNGQVIEARGVKYGVDLTDLNQGQGWAYWSKSPWIDYEVSGIYDIAGRRVFLDNGEDIGQERWIAKYVYGDESAGSTYTPYFDPYATYTNALPAVYDADPLSVDNGVIVPAPSLSLVDQILAVVDTLPYDEALGFFYNQHWYQIRVDANGVPTAVLNDPAPSATQAAPDPTQTQRPSQGQQVQAPAQTAAPEPTPSESIEPAPPVIELDEDTQPQETAPAVEEPAAKATPEAAQQEDYVEPAPEAQAAVQAEAPTF